MSAEFEITTKQVDDAVHTMLGQIAAKMVDPRAAHCESKILPMRLEWDDGPMAFVHVEPEIQNWRFRFEGQLPSPSMPFSIAFCARVETGHVEDPDPEFFEGQLTLSNTNSSVATRLDLSHMQALYDAWVAR